MGCPPPFNDDPKVPWLFLGQDEFIHYLKGPFDQRKSRSIHIKTVIMANDSGSVLLALLVGAVIGAGAGILYAPDEGAKTRRRIKDKAKETSEDLAGRMDELRAELNKSAKEQKAEFDKKLEETISKMSYQADDIIAGLEQRLEELRKKNAQFQK